jgi:hypothetical protein
MGEMEMEMEIGMEMDAVRLVLVERTCWCRASMIDRG